MDFSTVDDAGGETPAAALDTAAVPLVASVGQEFPVEQDSAPLPDIVPVALPVEGPRESAWLRVGRELRVGELRDR